MFFSNKKCHPLFLIHIVDRASFPLGLKVSQPQLSALYCIITRQPFLPTTVVSLWRLGTLCIKAFFIYLYIYIFSEQVVNFTFASVSTGKFTHNELHLSHPQMLPCEIDHIWFILYCICVKAPKACNINCIIKCFKFIHNSSGSDICHDYFYPPTVILVCLVLVVAWRVY